MLCVEYIGQMIPTFSNQSLSANEYIYAIMSYILCCDGYTPYCVYLSVVMDRRHLQETGA